VTEFYCKKGGYEGGSQSGLKEKCRSIMEENFYVEEKEEGNREGREFRRDTRRREKTKRVV